MASYAKLMNELEELALPKMQENLDVYTDLVNQGKMEFTQALEELVSKECEYRRERQNHANIHKANFPFLKTFDDFDFSFQPALNKAEIIEFANLGFVEKNENIVFVGSSGVGKTHLATSVGIECAKRRYSTYFITFENLMNQLKKALNENRLDSRLKFFSGYKVLIIDELGYMPVDIDAANLFFQLIARRYEKHSTIVTTNMPFSKWAEVFGSATLSNAVLDRLLHHSTIISIKGPSYRLKGKHEFFRNQSSKS
jgi:DNA replication protein DnaC